MKGINGRKGKKSTSIIESIVMRKDKQLQDDILQEKELKGRDWGREGKVGRKGREGKEKKRNRNN